MGSVADLRIPLPIKQKLEKAVKALRDICPDARILLFGSLAKGDWLEDSDIDLIVISECFSKMEYVTRVMLLKSKLFEMGLSRVHVIPLTVEEFDVQKRRSVVVSDAVEYAVEIL